MAKCLDLAVFLLKKQRLIDIRNHPLQNGEDRSDEM